MAFDIYITCLLWLRWTSEILYFHLADAPFDVVLTTKEYRSWFDKNANTIKITTKPESTHYHINPVCVRKRNPSFGATKHLQVSADDREKLLPCHKQLLEQSLNILIQYEINKGVSKAVFSVR